MVDELVREFGDGMERAAKRSLRKPGRVARLGTKRRLDRLCRERPDTVRATVEEMALMRAGWQKISYRRSVAQIVAAMLSEEVS